MNVLGHLPQTGRRSRCLGWVQHERTHIKNPSFFYPICPYLLTSNPSACSSIYFFSHVFPTIYSFILLFSNVFAHPSLTVSLHPCFHPSIFPSTHHLKGLYLSFYLYICPSFFLCLSFYSYIHTLLPSIYPAFVQTPSVTKLQSPLSGQSYFWPQDFWEMQQSIQQSRVLPRGQCLSSGAGLNFPIMHSIPA